MKHAKYFNAEGVIKLAPRQGEKTKPKTPKDDEEIQICLTCTREKCTGFCKRIEERNTKKGK